MSVRDESGYTPMQNLIKRLPEAAKVRSSKIRPSFRTRQIPMEERVWVRVALRTICDSRGNDRPCSASTFIKETYHTVMQSALLAWWPN
jgi:hypothetical protein